MRRLMKRGFTLVELMIVVAIIGVLAALAIYGVRKYLLSSKTSEAKNTIGAITRAAVAAFEREKLDGELLTPGNQSNVASHTLCGSSIQVPATAPVGKKYQPATAVNTDFDNGNTQTGWKCLKFSLTEPIYYSYKYDSAAAPTITCTTVGTAPGGGTPSWWTSAAGDLNGDTTTSFFGLPGQISNGKPIVGTTLIEVTPEE